VNEDIGPRVVIALGEPASRGARAVGRRPGSADRAVAHSGTMRR